MMIAGTTGWYDRMTAAMTDRRAGIARTSESIATGNRLLTPSDDPAGSAQLARIDRSLADTENFAANIGLAKGALADLEGAARGIADTLATIRERAVQALSGTLSADQRATLGRDIAGLAESLLGHANARDPRGQPLFGGTGSADAFARVGGVLTPTNPGPASAVPVDRGVAIAVTLDGAGLLGNLFADVDALAAALIANDVDAARAANSGVGEGETRVIAALADIGTRGRRLELIEGQADARTLRERERRSALADTDIASAIVDMQAEMTALEAAQASFARVASLSLFDYLR